MELDWSEQSPHIRTLYRPWQPGDGHDENTLQEAEVQLGVRLPPMLRNFYLAWGRRHLVQELTKPLELKVLGGALVFSVEVIPDEETVYYRGIPCKALDQADPPVLVSLVKWMNKGRLKLNWKPFSPSLSGLLDDLTYEHAFYRGGAVHGGSVWSLPDLPAQQRDWLEEHWSKATVTWRVFASSLDPDDDSPPPLYIRDGQALWWRGHSILRLVMPTLLMRLASSSKSPGRSDGEREQ